MTEGTKQVKGGTLITGCKPLPHQQPKEYIITEKQLRHYIKFSNYPSSEIDTAIRSRPHPAPSQKFEKINYHGGKCCCEDYYNCHDCRNDRQFNKEHDTAIARKAREDVLKQIKQHLIDEYHYPDIEDWLIEELMSYIQNNIDSTQQQAGDQHDIH